MAYEPYALPAPSLISGEREKDHTVPWTVTNAAFKRQQRNKGLTEIVEVPATGTCSPSTAAGATSPARCWLRTLHPWQ
jgi:hypothetical protein